MLKSTQSKTVVLCQNADDPQLTKDFPNRSIFP